MKRFKIVAFSLMVLLISSCNRETVADYSDWRNQNITYFENMKDSSEFVYDSVLTNYGYVGYFYNIVIKGDTSTTSPGYYDVVKVNYKGQDIEGNIFDKTYTSLYPVGDSTATPAVFYTNQLISGWTINLMEMKEGEVRTVVLPSELAYGAYGAGNVILPYSTLRFDIHLVSVIN